MARCSARRPHDRDAMLDMAVASLAGIVDAGTPVRLRFGPSTDERYESWVGIAEPPKPRPRGPSPDVPYEQWVGISAPPKKRTRGPSADVPYESWAMESGPKEPEPASLRYEDWAMLDSKPKRQAKRRKATSIVYDPFAIDSDSKSGCGGCDGCDCHEESAGPALGWWSNALKGGCGCDDCDSEGVWWSAARGAPDANPAGASGPGRRGVVQGPHFYASGLAARFEGLHFDVIVDFSSRFPEPCNPDEPFDPPRPAIWDRTDNECDRVEQDIEENEAVCDVPDVGCDCTTEWIAYTPPGGEMIKYLSDPCGDACHPDMVNTRSSPSLEIMGAGNSNVSDTERDLVNAAWNMLQANDDIVEWIVCLAEGANNAECVRRRLFDSDDPQKITIDPAPPRKYGDANAWAGAFSEHIHISTVPGRTMAVVADDYEDAIERGDVTDQACAIARLAQLILHEMVHGCLPLWEEANDQRGDCDTPHMIDNSFTWAMGQRFPCLEFGAGCSNFGDDDMWMSDA